MVSVGRTLTSKTRNTKGDFWKQIMRVKPDYVKWKKSLGSGKKPCVGSELKCLHCLDHLQRLNKNCCVCLAMVEMRLK